MLFLESLNFAFFRFYNKPKLNPKKEKVNMLSLFIIIIVCYQPMEHDLTSNDHAVVEEKEKVFGEVSLSTNLHAKTGICWFKRPRPMTLSAFFSKSGADKMLLYTWMAKDLSWMQGWYYPGFVFGSASVCITGVIVILAFISKDISEIFSSVGFFLWIFANIWWYDIKLS